jgi:DNA adenine methylase
MVKMPPYIGGKSGAGTYQQIINRIPPHSVYVEPFLGHGGIFRHKKIASLSILNDINQQIIDRWRKIKIPGCQVSEDRYQGNLFNKPDKPVVVFSQHNGIKLIQRFNKSLDTFIYCDPPYLIQARRSQQKLYAYEWETDADHINLAAALHTVNCNVMISTNVNDLYYKLYKGWNVHKFKSTTRAGSQDELIFFNYDPPEVLHDCRYLGNDYRERDYLKRKIKRWQSRLQSLPQHERIALISDIVNNYKSQTQKLIQL